MKTIGIDIGTTTISVVVADTETKSVLTSRTISSQSFIQTDKEWAKIQDVSKIIGKMQAVLDEFMAQYPDVKSIGCTGQMHGILYLDKDGKCISPLYTWQDQRAGEVIDGTTTVQYVQEKAGINVPIGYGLITHITNIRLGEVPEGTAAICTIPDYVGMYLTDRTKPLMHISNAASIGFFDSRKKEFIAEAFEAAGGDAAMLPEVTGNADEVGTYKGIPVIAAIGDNQASFIGSAGMQENTILLNLGTGGQISVLSKEFIEADGIEARPITNDYYLLAGSSLCGGRAYAILEKFFREYAIAIGAEDAAQYDIMAKLAAISLSEDQMEVTTTFNGTRTDPTKRGSIVNISEENFTPAGLVQGTLRGMAKELHDHFEVMSGKTDVKAEHLIGSGNGVRRNKAMQEILSEMFGTKVELASCEEEAACGAAFYGIVE